MAQPDVREVAGAEPVSDEPPLTAVGVEFGASLMGVRPMIGPGRPGEREQGGHGERGSKAGGRRGFDHRGSIPCQGVHGLNRLDRSNPAPVYHLDREKPAPAARGTTGRRCLILISPTGRADQRGHDHPLGRGTVIPSSRLGVPGRLVVGPRPTIRGRPARNRSTLSPRPGRITLAFQALCPNT